MSKARDLANASTALNAVSPTELGYLDGVTSAVQTQIDAKIGQSTAINPTIVDAKGDLIAATAADTVSRLAVGTDGYVLKADSTQATGLGWTAPPSGGAWSQVATGSLTGTTVSITGLTGKQFLVILDGYSHVSTGVESVCVRLNNDSAANYYSGSQSGPLTQLVIGNGFTGASNYYLSFFVNNANNATQFKNIGTNQQVSSAASIGGNYKSTSSITSIQLGVTSFTVAFDAGTYYIWAFN